jgi:outer membrane protein TolC
MKPYKKILLTAIVLGSWHVSQGQQYPDSLLQYLGIAAENNPAVLQKFTEYQIALQKIPQVGSLSDPELSLGVFLKPMELVSGNQVADIRLMQMFPWFGVLKNAKDEMSLMANAKFELLRDAKLQVFYDVQRTWYQLYKIRKDINITEKNIEILKTIERLALVRFKSAPSGGAGTQSMEAAPMGSSTGGSGLADLYRIQMEAGELENSIALLKNQEQSVVALFNGYLNRLPDSPVFTDKILSADTLGLSLIAVSDSMLIKNPMLSMLEFEKQSVDARKKMVTAMGYPMVGLGLNYSIINKNVMSESTMNGTDMIMPMISVTIPVYRKKYNAMKNEAELMKTATSQNYEASVNALQTEYYSAVQMFRDAGRRIELYKNQFRLASSSFDLMLKSFSTSSSGLTDVLRVRQQMLDYELKQVEAVADYNTAIAWLNRLMANSQIQ